VPSHDLVARDSDDQMERSARKKKACEEVNAQQRLEALRESKTEAPNNRVSRTSDVKMYQWVFGGRRMELGKAIRR
jgi:hypothetical protein